MGSDGDISVSLPNPPPPNPAARRAAIDAAMRKFDGLPEAPAPRQPRRLAWSTMHRRPAGALLTAALVAVIAIPAIQLGLPDRPAEEETSEQPAPGRMQLPEVRNEPSETAASPQPAADEPLTDAAPSRSEAPATQATTTTAEQRNRFAAPAEDRAARQEAPLPMRAAPPPPPMAMAPPPPPPPSAKAQQEAQADAIAEDSGSIVVTGSRVQRPNLESASPVTVIGATANDFLSNLRSALDSNDRRAVMRLVAIPLRVNFSDGRRTYRSSRDIERDFDRIFTPAVRRAVDDLSSYDLASGDGGRLRGADRIWFGCGKTVCRDEAAIRIREITP